MHSSFVPPRRRALSMLLASTVATALFVGGLVPPAAPAQAQGAGVNLEWFGWSAFRLTSTEGKVILLNPFVKNPDSTVSLEDLTKVDLILAPDAHGDEIGSTEDIAKSTGAKVIVPGELAGWFIERGVPQAQFPVRFASSGDRYRLDGVTVRVVAASHGSGLGEPTAKNPYGGIANGFIVTFENGWTVYFQGSTGMMSEMALWAEMYKPDAVIFHMGASHEPMDIAMGIKLLTTNNPNLKTLIPHHNRVQPPAGATTIADVQAALSTLGVNIPITETVRSQVYTFSK
ncbi:MAG: MBL fold metallo-hydrolase [Chloroflexota bacterium]